MSTEFTDFLLTVRTPSRGRFNFAMSYVIQPLVASNDLNLWFELQEDGTLIPLRVEHLS